MTATKRYQFELVGGRACLDFVNTVSGMRGANDPRDRLAEYADLVSWFQQAGLVDAKGAARLLRLAGEHPRRAAAALQEAVQWREALYRVLLAGAQGERVDPAALAEVSARVAAALAQRRLQPAAGGGVALQWDDAGDNLLAPLREVAASAGELLASADLARVRVCGEHETGNCAWLFLDQTKNKSRRWCVMSDCGNRAKQRRHYQRGRVSTRNQRT